MQGPQYQAGRTRLRRGTASVVIGSSEQVTITPASGQSTTIANGQLLMPNGTAASPSLAFSTRPGFGWKFTPNRWDLRDNAGGVDVALFNNDGTVSVHALRLTPAAPDITLSRSATGSLLFTVGNNGAALGVKMLSELTTIAAAATTDTTIQIPAGAQVVAVSSRVTVQPGGTSTVDSGVAGATTRYGTAFSTAANTTNRGTDDGIRFYGSAVSVRYTPNAVPSDAAGRIRTTIHYLDITPPTS